MGNTYTIDVDAVFDLSDQQHCWMAVTGKNGASASKSIGSVFADIDENEDGVITFSELARYFRCQNVNICDDAEFRDLWLDADEDHDNCITYEEFWKVMTRAKETYQGHPKWRTLLHAINVSVDAGNPLEVRLYKIDAYGGVTHVGRKPLVGNNSNVIETSLHRKNFVAGFEYFACVYEMDETTTKAEQIKEVAKSTRIKCIDSSRALREKQRQLELRRQQALTNAATQQAAAQKAAYARSLVQAHKYHAFMRQQRELAERQKEREVLARHGARASAKTESYDYVKQRISRGAASAINNVFNEIDKDENGVISYAEFNHFCKQQGVTDEVVSRMFREVDYYGGGDFDGNIDRSEFRKIMNLAGEWKASTHWNALYEKYGREVGTERPTVREQKKEKEKKKKKKKRGIDDDQNDEEERPTHKKSRSDEGNESEFIPLPSTRSTTTTTHDGEGEGYKGFEGTSLRNQAAAQHAEKTRLVEEAHKEYAAGNSETAQRLNKRVKEAGEAMREYNLLARDAIYRHNNDGKGAAFLDLHGLHVDEALHYFERKCRERRGVGFECVTGAGNNSQFGIAKIKEAVVAWCDRHGVRYEMKNVGALGVSC